MHIAFGPYNQILTLRGLALKGPLRDEDLEIIPTGGIVIEDDLIKAIGPWEDIDKTVMTIRPPHIQGPSVVMPGMVDSHTHLVHGGHRAGDYAQRLAGKSYQEIAAGGGGIWSTVEKTRAATEEELFQTAWERLQTSFRQGITTIEIKSGYGLNTEQELKMLEVIQRLGNQHPVDVVSTCLAAHVPDKSFRDRPEAYVEDIVQNLLPEVKRRDLARRVDIFVEKNAFSPELGRIYLQAARKLGFDLTVHADQFSSAGSALAIELQALSADHLEASTPDDIRRLAGSEVVATVLPGATLGLGQPFAPARVLLDAGCCLAIASDWNPGSAPRGDLLTSAALLSAAEKLTTAETLAGLTFRAAQALKMNDRGRLAPGMLADWLVFPCADYREILYHQGILQPAEIIKKGITYHV